MLTLIRLMLYRLLTWLADVFGLTSPATPPPPVVPWLGFLGWAADFRAYRKG